MLGWRLFSKYGGISANRRSITRAVRLAGLSSESQCSRGRGNNRRRHSGRRQIRSSSWGNWRRANPPWIARAIHFARRLFGVFRAELESLRPLVEAILPTGARHPCRLHLAAVTGPSNPTKGSAPIGSTRSIGRLPFLPGPPGTAVAGFSASARARTASRKKYASTRRTRCAPQPRPCCLMVAPI